MGQTGEKWDKTRGEVGHIQMSGLAVKTAPDSVMAGLEAAQRDQMGPDRSTSVYLASQQVQIRPQQNKTKLSQTGRWQARQLHSMSRRSQAGCHQVRHKQTLTPPDRTADRPGSTTTGQYNAELGATGQTAP